MNKRKVAIQVVLILLLSSFVSAQGRDTEAAHLQAFYLTGELMDYANRVKSARSYLMAAELMLEHPVKPLKSKVRERREGGNQVMTVSVRPSPLDLVAKARDTKSFRSAGIAEWAGEIERRSKQQVRATDSDYATGILQIGPSAVQELAPTFRSGRLSRVVARTPEGALPLSIKVTDRNGTVVAQGEGSVSFTVPRERRLSVTLQNPNSQKLNYELLIR